MWAGGVRVVIVDGDKKVLMVRQSHEGNDIWMLPGGAIEEGENAKQAAAREVREETGLEVAVGPMLWHVEEVSGERGQRFVNFFLAEATGGTLELGADPELKAGEQVLREARFISRWEMDSIERVYPEYLKDELWDVLAMGLGGYNAFKLRQGK